MAEQIKLQNRLKEINQELNQLKQTRKKVKSMLQFYSVVKEIKQDILYPVSQSELANFLISNESLLIQKNVRFIPHHFTFSYALERIHGYHSWVRCDETDDMWNEGNDKVTLGLFTKQGTFLEEEISELFLHLKQDTDAYPKEDCDTGKRVLGRFEVECKGVLCHYLIAEKIDCLLLVQETT
jgi:hypothetical protein